MTSLNLDHRLATARLHEQLAYLKLPANPWVPPGLGPDGQPLLDVAIIGAGMFGTAAGAALALKGVTNIALFDESAPGRAGPWTTYARMPTLRSLKDLPGLALGVPALSFRAWYEAVHGEQAWAGLYKIPNAVWQQYLGWVAEALALPVQHQVRIERFSAQPGYVSFTDTQGRTRYARRLVIASGRAGAGGPNIPAFIEPELFPVLAAHNTEAIDFQALAGRRLAILGAGASAWDNAATALEHGAAQVTLYARRAFLPQINKGRGAGYPGFVAGWHALPAAQRWALADYLEQVQAPVPHETILRTLAAGQQRLQVRFDARVERIYQAAGQVQVKLAGAIADSADYLIVGTGYQVNLAQAPLFAEEAARIALWQDRFTPPPEQARPEFGRYPWLGPGFELQAKEQADGDSPLNRVHLFNHGAGLSFGTLVSDIPAVSAAAERLAGHIVPALFTEQFAAHFEALKRWEVEWELEPTPYYHSGQGRNV